MKKRLIQILALTLIVGAVQLVAASAPPATTPIPPVPVNPLQVELDATKAKLSQTETVAQEQINALTVRAERGEYAYRATIAAQENLALRNALAQAQKELNDAQEKNRDLQTRYDMEKAKVEALLKKHPGESAAAQAAPKPDAIPIDKK